MAQALTPETARDVVSPKHNVAAHHQAIRDTFKTVLGLERQKDSLEEEHIEPVKKAIREKWQTLKADCDIELTDLKLQYKLWKRQEEAKLFDEAEERDRVQDGLRLIFEALNEGEMLDFISGIEQIEKEDKNAGKAEDAAVFDEAEKVAAARRIGFDHAMAGEQTTDACPYPEGSEEAEAWTAGTVQAQEQIATAPNNTRRDEMQRAAKKRLKNKPAPKTSTQVLEHAEPAGAA